MLLRALAVLAALVAMNPRTDPVEVTFRVDVPEETPADAGVFIAGDFQGWDPGSAAHQLTKTGDHAYEITIDFEVNSSIEYKFTRGDWARVEKGRQGEEISNRALTVTAAAVLEHTVANWADMSSGNAPARQPTIVGNVTRIDVPGFLNGRGVWVYLPPGYEDSGQRYPVLYMLDGQNVFDESTSFAGEWRVDESCQRLIAAGEMRPIIVVAVANGGNRRTDEYTPWYDTGHKAGGAADAHLGAIVDVLVPYVNQSYRTLTGPANTGFAGSSLGGLISLYVTYEHAETFGLIAAVSPSLWWNGHKMVDWAVAWKKPDVRLYMDMGTLESNRKKDGNGNGVDDSIDALRTLRGIMLGQGFVSGDDLLVVEDEGAKHHETFWAARFPAALRFLFPPEGH